MFWDSIVLSSYFINPSALKALYIIIPLILIYLIRPRPKKLKIPSLMFLMKSKGKTTSSSFLKYFLRDFLFFVQLLILLLLAVSIAQPFMVGTKNVAAAGQVIIIDNSASSQTSFRGISRLDRGVAIVKDKLAARNTIIAAHAAPELIVEQADYSDSVDAIRSITSKDTQTNLGSAIAYSSRFFQKGEGKLIVVSDFIHTDISTDLASLKAGLEARGIQVEFISTYNEEEKNVGIIDLDVERDECSIAIRNYMDEVQNVKIKIGDQTLTQKIDANSIEHLAFVTPTASTKIELLVNDNFKVDNIININIPQDRMVNVLFITNTKNSYLRSAFESISNVNVEIANPPVFPDFNHDIIVLDQIDKGLLLPGVVKDIESAVKKGGDLIINVQEGFFALNLQRVLPIEYLGEGQNAGIINNYQDYGIAKELDFGKAVYYMKVKMTKNMTVIAQTPDESPIIAIDELGAGRVMYFGIFERHNDFKYSPFYPIFWKNVVDTFVDDKDIRNLNFKTGQMLNLKKKAKVKMPNGETATKQNLFLDQAGYYYIDGKKIVANLLDERESDISFNAKKESRLEKAMKAKQIEIKERKDLSLYVILAGLFFMLIELMIIKHRGDI